MSLAVVHSRSLVGLDAPEVRVEVHLANGLPSCTLVGLADTEVKEARERVRAALAHSGLGFPYNKRITVSLAPADLPKESGRFDLPIALGILAAAGELDATKLPALEFARELSLARRRAGGTAALVLPPGSAEEAALVDGVEVRRAAHLLDVVRALRPGDAAEPLARSTAGARPAPAPSACSRSPPPAATAC
jgi:magnesium chelatase family protein